MMGNIAWVLNLSNHGESKRPDWAINKIKRESGININILTSPKRGQDILISEKLELIILDQGLKSTGLIMPKDMNGKKYGGTCQLIMTARGDSPNNQTPIVVMIDFAGCTMYYDLGADECFNFYGMGHPHQLSKLIRRHIPCKPEVATYYRNV